MDHGLQYIFMFVGGVGHQVVVFITCACESLWVAFPPAVGLYPRACVESLRACLVILLSPNPKLRWCADLCRIFNLPMKTSRSGDRAETAKVRGWLAPFTCVVCMVWARQPDSSNSSPVKCMKRLSSEDTIWGVYWGPCFSHVRRSNIATSCNIHRPKAKPALMQGMGLSPCFSSGWNLQVVLVFRSERAKETYIFLRWNIWNPPRRLEQNITKW